MFLALNLVFTCEQEVKCWSTSHIISVKCVGTLRTMPTVLTALWILHLFHTVVITGTFLLSNKISDKAIILSLVEGPAPTKQETGLWNYCKPAQEPKVWWTQKGLQVIGCQWLAISYCKIH